MLSPAAIVRRVDRVGRRALAVGDRVRGVRRDRELVLRALAEVARQRAADRRALGLGVRRQLQRRLDRQVLPRAAVRVQRRRRPLDLELAAGLDRDAVAAVRDARRRIAPVVGAGDRDRARERQDEERMVAQRRTVEIAVGDARFRRRRAVAAGDRADDPLGLARDRRVRARGHDREHDHADEEQRSQVLRSGLTALSAHLSHGRRAASPLPWAAGLKSALGPAHDG